MRACAHSVEVLVGVRIVRSHAIMQVVINVCVVQRYASVQAVSGVRLVVLLLPLIVVHFVSQFSYCISSSNSFP